MAERKSGKKTPARRAPAAKRSAAARKTKKSPAKSTPRKSSAHAAEQTVHIALEVPAGGVTLGKLKPAAGSRPKRQRIGRGHGSGMVKTGGEGGKGQTVRSGGGKGRHFEGGQTPWARRLPHRRGYSQKARDIGHFRVRYAVVNLHQLSTWDSAIEVTPESLRERGIVSRAEGVKILGGTRSGASLPAGLRFRDVLLSRSAREALEAAGASIEAPTSSAE